jgi:signal transduction histidine kinase
MNDEFRLTLFWTTCAVAVISGVFAVVSGVLAVTSQPDFMFWTLLNGASFLTLGTAALLINRGMMSAGILLSLGSTLVFGSITALRFPDLSLTVALTCSLACVVIGSICSPRLSYTLLVGAMLQLTLIVLKPATLIQPVDLGSFSKFFSLGGLLPVVFFGGLLARRLVERERQAQRALADALERLKAAQDQLLQNAQDRAVTDLATAAAHELAQPLTIILSEAGLLRDEPLSGGARASLNNLYTAAVRASRILGRIREARRYVTTSYLPGSTMVDLDRASE